MNHFNPEILSYIQSEVASLTPQQLNDRFLEVYSMKDKANESRDKLLINKKIIFAKWELKKN